MKEYDFAFSLGFSCGVSQALRASGLQFASYPLDWIASRGILASVRAVESDFAHWMDLDDLVLRDVRHGTGFLTRAYVNTRTDMGFSHEFNDFIPFSETYPKIRASYEHRAKRFVQDTAKAGRILAVWLEMPMFLDPDVGIYREALARLRKKWPGKEVDLIVFSECPDCGEPHDRVSEEGLTVVAADYRKMEGKSVGHFVDFNPFIRYLKPRFSMRDPRTAEEKAKYAVVSKEMHTLRWGADKSRFRQWLNKHAYKTFRSLEAFLQKRGLVHSEGLFWFWDEYDRLAEGGAQ